jgi:hypothetical protein
MEVLFSYFAIQFHSQEFWIVRMLYLFVGSEDFCRFSVKGELENS